MEKFRDLSRNERTYLAWVRTAISILIFGFLLRTAQDFLAVFAVKSSIALPVATSTAINVVGIAMIVIAVLIIITATIRFIIQKISILRNKEVEHASVSLSKVLALFLVIVALFLIVYLAVLVLPPI